MSNIVASIGEDIYSNGFNEGKKDRGLYIPERYPPTAIPRELQHVWLNGYRDGRYNKDQKEKEVMTN